MKKTSILDFFKCQPELSKVNCPACDTIVLKAKLNEHLDLLCTSSADNTNTNRNNTELKSSSSTGKILQKGKKTSTTSSKLNLKTQRKRNVKSKLTSSVSTKEALQESDDEIVILKEISSPKGKTTGFKNRVLSEECGLRSSINDKDDKTLNGSLSPIKKSCVNKKISTDCKNLKNVSKKRKSSESLNENKSVKKCLNLDNHLSNASKSKVVDREDAPRKEKDSFKNATNNNETNKDLKVDSIDESVDLNQAVLTCETGSVKSEVISSNDSRKEKNEQEISSYQNVFENASAFSELSDNDEAEEKTEKTYAPYYIANFKYILEAVLSNEDNKVLFNEEDMLYVNAFISLSDASQKMYVRLFQRKYKWLRIDKIKYPDITADSFATLEEIAKVKLVDSGSCDIDLETAMNLLSLQEAKNLAKHFNFNSGKNKAEIKEMLIKHSKQHKSVFFMSGQNGIANIMLKKLRQIIGPCYRLSLLPKRLFTRILMLFNLPLLSEDDDDSAAGGQQQQLLTLLQINKGELSFPEYKQTKQTVIFIDRDELIRYEEARQLENDIFSAVEYKKFDKAKELYIEAKEEYEDQLSKSFVDRAVSLPVFLKRYTSFHVYIRCMTQGVEILQKLRQYKEAVSLLRSLLKQKIFCQDYKGRWYDRLALNLEQHLKKPQKALEAIKESLEDKNVRKGHRYSLLARGLRITKSLDDDDELKKMLLREADVIEAPKVCIKGRLCPRSILGRRHVFISQSSVCSGEDDVTILGVEQLAIEHYKGEGYIEGIHGEGSTFISLYALLFWDIIYDGNVPDVFISPYQTHPMDLNSDVFFPNREEQILSHLKTIKFATNEELKEIIKVCWLNNHGKASLVSWDRFRDLEHVQSLVVSFGNCFLSGICERLARDFRFSRSGVPDLVVWNPESLKVKVIEVKGPGDKLSSKQILWLDYLIKLGVDAEVCLVEAEASKKLRKEMI